MRVDTQQYIYALRTVHGRAYYVGHTGYLHGRIKQHITNNQPAFTVDILEYLGLDNTNYQRAERWWVNELIRRGEPIQNQLLVS
jgi:hypothetical protein